MTAPKFPDVIESLGPLTEEEKHTLEAIAAGYAVNKKGKPGKKATGRPPALLAKATRDTVCNFVAAGNWPEVAASMVGLSRSVFFKWTKMGGKIQRDRDCGVNFNIQTIEPNEAAALLFVDALARANAECETRMVLVISKEAQTNWNAAAFRLERRFPERWSRRNDVNMTGAMAVANVDSASIRETAIKTINSQIESMRRELESKQSTD